MLQSDGFAGFSPMTVSTNTLTPPSATGSADPPSAQDGLPAFETRRRGLPRWLRLLLVRGLIGVVGLAGWQMLSNTAIGSVWISSPSLIATRLWQLHADGSLYVHTGVTVLQAFTGLTIGFAVGIAIGIVRAGLPGALAAWLGFTLPSAIALVAFAFGLQRFGVTDAGWLHGLKIAAVAVVANAVWGMARSLAPDRERATLAIVSAIVVLAWPGAPGQRACP